MTRASNAKVSRRSARRKRISGKAEKAARTRRRPTGRWSQRVTRKSDALDLERGVFTLRDPKRIAVSLKRSAEHSSRRKQGAYRSALSMLIFYINRAGRKLSKTRRERLDRAKTELKRQFGNDGGSWLKNRPASAANLKFLSISPRIRYRNFKFKAALETISC